MSNVALSWPGPDYENNFVMTIGEMFENLGYTVRGFNPVSWSAPSLDANLIIAHWPDAIFWPNPSKARLWFWIMRTVANLAFLKLKGAKLVWVTHNLFPHDLPKSRAFAWRVYSHLISSLTDGWVTLAPSTGSLVERTFPKLLEKPKAVVWHPPYDNCYNGTREEARMKFSLLEHQIAFGHVGLLRPYKNLSALTGNFPNIFPPDSRLIIAGEAKDGVERELSELEGKAGRYSFRRGRLTKSEFDQTLTAIDVFIAPYKDFLHSGALIHALSRNCVIVAPYTCFARDLQIAVGENWVELFHGQITRETINNASKKAKRVANCKPDLSPLEPRNNQAELSKMISLL